MGRGQVTELQASAPLAADGDVGLVLCPLWIPRPPGSGVPWAVGMHSAHGGAK